MAGVIGCMPLPRSTLNLNHEGRFGAPPLTQMIWLSLLRKGLKSTLRTSLWTPFLSNTSMSLNGRSPLRMPSCTCPSFSPCPVCLTTHSRFIHVSCTRPPKTSKNIRKLKAAVEAPNLDFSGRLDDKALVEILARLRTLELVDVPPGWQQVNWNRAFANAYLAGRDMIALILYVCFCTRSMPHTCLEFGFQLGEICWLGLKCSRYSRRDAWLLTVIGNDTWSVGWHRLRHGSSIYWAVRSRMACSRFGPSIYLGESCCTARRICEHIFRILRPQGCNATAFVCCVAA